MMSMIKIELHLMMLIIVALHIVVVVTYGEVKLQ